VDTFSATEIRCFCRWNFSVSQHDVLFVPQRSDGHKSSRHSRYHERIATHSSHLVGDSCAKTKVNKDQDTEDAEDDDDAADQCHVQSR